MVLGGWSPRVSAELKADFVVNCAGLHSDRVARIFGARPATRIVPFRGDYFTLARPELVRHLVYPVPDPAFPFLGVHFTRMIGGGVECGPTAVLSLNREGYRPNSVRVRDAIDAVTFPGLWRFVARHPGATWRELQRSKSPGSVSRFAATPRAERDARGPETWSRGRARAGDAFQRHARSGLRFRLGTRGSPRAQRAEPGRDRVAGHRRRNHPSRGQAEWRCAAYRSS